MDLRVSPEQEDYVASNAFSIAQTHYYDYAWFRAIFAGEDPLGFVMLGDPDADLENKYFLSCFMLDQRYQKKGYGKGALNLIVDYVKTRPNATKIYTSYGPGDHSPCDFYLKYGFEATGNMIGEEVELVFDLTTN